MAHKRREIRAHIVSIIKAGNTTAGNRVYPSRVRAGVGLTFPIVAVYTPRETLECVGVNPREYSRTLELVIECLSEDISVEVENKLDILMNEIEGLIDTNENLIPDVSDVEFSGSSVDLFNSGERDTASGVMRYQIKYYTREDIPHPGTLEAVIVNGQMVETN